MNNEQLSGTRNGVVLIVVLVLVMMVSLAGFGFLAAMSTEYEGSRLNGSMRQAQQTMASAESTLTWFASLSKRDRQALGGWHNNPRIFRGQIVEPLTAMGSANTNNLPGTQEQLSLVADQNDDRWRFSVVTLDRTPEQRSVLRFGLQNESSKLHLANLLRWDQAIPGHGRFALMQLPGMTESIADCILDWMDADDLPREFGAENDYYQTLNRPYSAANTIPRRLTELMYVKGVTRRLLNGTQAADPMATDYQIPSSAELSGSDSGNDFASDPAIAGLGWRDFLTVDSAEKNQNQSGRSRIFLNTGNLVELEQQLNAVLPENLARYLLLARIYGLSPSAGSGVEPSAAPFTSSMVPAFQIASAADLIDSVIPISAQSGAMVVQSPLQSGTPDFPALISTLLDNVTTVPEKTIAGRINILTASETVLRTVPDMTPESVSQIVTLRDSLEIPEVDSVAWLLIGNVLDIATFRKVFPELTVGGDAFQCEIVVHRAIGGPVLRQNLILDAASTPLRRIQWTDLTESQLRYSHKLLLPPVQ